MDTDNNGNLDIIQNTIYDYECNRDNVDDNDQNDDTDDLSSDLEDEVTDSDLIDEEADVEAPDMDNNEPEAFDSDQVQESSGCSLTKLL